MSIFDQQWDEKFEIDYLKQFLEKIKNWDFWSEKVATTYWCWGPYTNERSWNHIKDITWEDVANEYLVKVFKGVAFEFLFKSLNESEIKEREWIELFYNILYYIKEEIDKTKYNPIENKTLRTKLVNRTECNGLFNAIHIYLKHNNLGLVQVDQEKYCFKLINKDVLYLSNQIKSYKWRNEINKYFTIGNDNWEKKSKSLAWFAVHIRGSIKKRIKENKNNYFSLKKIAKLFSDLTHIYRHYGKIRENANLERFDKFNKLSLEKRNKKADEDVWFITYLLIEYGKEVAEHAKKLNEK